MPASSPIAMAGSTSPASSQALPNGSSAPGMWTVRCGRTKPPRSWASRLSGPTWTPRHGWSNGAANEPALGQLGRPRIVRAARGQCDPRSVATGQRIGGHTVHDDAEQHGHDDDGYRGLSHML